MATSAVDQTGLRRIWTVQFLNGEQQGEYKDDRPEGGVSLAAWKMGREVTVRRFVAVDDCGNIINPVIVQGQIHGGVTQGLGPTLYEEIPYDEDGNNLAGSFMDYLVPTAVETPVWETGHTVTPPPPIAYAVVDALAHLGVTHMVIPIRPDWVWEVSRGRGVAGGASARGEPKGDLECCQC